MHDVATDFITGQVSADGTAKPLGEHIRCERIRITNAGSNVVYIGKVGVTTSTGFAIDGATHDFMLEYSGFIDDFYVVTASATQVISWIALV